MESSGPAEVDRLRNEAAHEVLQVRELMNEKVENAEKVSVPVPLAVWLRGVTWAKLSGRPTSLSRPYTDRCTFLATSADFRKCTDVFVQEAKM